MALLILILFLLFAATTVVAGLATVFGATLALSVGVGDWLQLNRTDSIAAASVRNKKRIMDITINW